MSIKNTYNKINNSGFTLMELLVVISIISLLSSLGIVSLNSARVKARDALRKGEMAQLRTALSIYFDEYNRYPVSACEADWTGVEPEFGTEVDLSASSDCYNNDLTAELEGGARPIMPRVPLDPLNQNNNPITDPLFLYRYITTGNGREYVVVYRTEEDPLNVEYMRGW